MSCLVFSLYFRLFIKFYLSSSRWQIGLRLYMKPTLSWRLLLLRNKISKNLTSILAFKRSTWLQSFGVVSFIYAAMISMAFVSIDDPQNLLDKANDALPIADYEGVVTLVGDEAILKTPKVTYLLVDPEGVLHKSPYFAENSQLQSFRVCIEAERSFSKAPLKGSHAYKLFIKDLC